MNTKVAAPRPLAQRQVPQGPDASAIADMPQSMEGMRQLLHAVNSYAPNEQEG